MESGEGERDASVGVILLRLLRAITRVVECKIGGGGRAGAGGSGEKGGRCEGESEGVGVWVRKLWASVVLFVGHFEELRDEAETLLSSLHRLYRHVFWRMLTHAGAC